MNNMLWLWVGLGGFVGSVLRWLISVNLPLFTNLPVPAATFLVNLIGSFLIGIGLGITNSYTDSRYLAFGLTGFCGGFTTFSTFSAENMRMVQDGNLANFAIYSS